MQQQEGNFQGVKTSPEDRVYCSDPRQMRDKKMRSSHSNNKMFSSKLKHKHKDKNQLKTARPIKLIDFETHIIPEMTVEYNIQAFNISLDES